MAVKQPLTLAPTNPDTFLVTTTVLKALLVDLQTHILSDIVTIYRDIRGLSGRMGVLENTTSDHTQQLATLQQTIIDLQQQAKRLDCHFAALEDMKVRGIKEDTSEAELPHLLKLLFQALLSQRQRKTLGLDGIFCVPKSSRALAAAPRDLVLQRQSGRDTFAILAMVSSLDSSFPLFLSDLQILNLWLVS
ncbi:Hypothetical predicted protein [Pelobates cultripes]|uniref:Uncharacterized protein n=1 Tax=Pelobates cultripes TaxID=61616 RepID=A0AAD1VMG8_PELCU|nr:Hypothetical predicted protein [Pelobates cultripes]